MILVNNFYEKPFYNTENNSPQSGEGEVLRALDLMHGLEGAAAWGWQWQINAWLDKMGMRELIQCLWRWDFRGTRTPGSPRRTTRG